MLASLILDFPLRYTICPLGSKSTVLDLQGEYPLYYKGVDKRKFMKAVQMLYGVLLHVCRYFCIRLMPFLVFNGSSLPETRAST